MGNLSSYLCFLSKSEPSPSLAYPQHSLAPYSTNMYGTSDSSSLTDRMEPSNGTEYTNAPLEVYKRSVLAEATRGFRESEIVGSGAFGHVYRGRMKGHLVAVKRSHPGALQGTREWIMEVRILERLRHPNVVRLLGYCAEAEELLLVYEYMVNGSVHDALFSETRGLALDWQQRMRIALNAALGMQYLHSHNLMHRDMKAANVLLDEDLTAKLTDFGLARHGPQGGDVDVPTLVRGTNGYICPHYLKTGNAGLAVDIYAFGVLLLELVTGKRNTFSDGQYLTKWVSMKSRNLPVADDEDDAGFSRGSPLERIDFIVDTAFHPISKQHNGIRSSMRASLWLADECTSSSPSTRPSATQVVARLEEIIGLTYENGRKGCI